MKTKPKQKNCRKYSFKNILWVSFGLAISFANADNLKIQVPLDSISQSTIAEDALSSLSGISAINISAGENNIQQNSAAISIATNNGFSASTVSPRQENQLASATQNVNSNQALKGEIRSGAFSEGLGIVMVNQSGGSGNSQVNGVAIALGAPGSFAAVELGDLELASQVSAVDKQLQKVLGGTAKEPSMEAMIADDSFSNAQGIVQINQVVGNGNRTVNALSVSLQIQSQ